jgi:hypothetical protein
MVKKRESSADRCIAVQELSIITLYDHNAANAIEPINSLSIPTNRNIIIHSLSD